MKLNFIAKKNSANKLAREIVAGFDNSNYVTTSSFVAGK